MNTRTRTSGWFPVLTLCLLLAGPAAAPLLAGDEAGWVGEAAGASPLLLEATDARITVTGTIARTVVTQTWQNPNRQPVDGLYVFPLPEDAAVTDMRLEVGDRVIRGEMKRREEARQIYEQARQEGRLAGLLDQERPNVFAQRVANLMPGQSVRVVIDYDQPVRREGSAYELVFPTVVGPRFVPASQADPGAILPPVSTSTSGSSDTGQRLSLEATIEVGMAIDRVSSPSHAVRVTRQRSGLARLVLAEDGGERLDRDVVLRWSVAARQPEVGVLAYRDPAQGNDGTFSLFVEPPAAPADEVVTPRELVFVLDCSGSMRGEPLDAAKDVVRQVLATLHPGDSFQIIRFSEQASGLSPEPLANTPANVQRAMQYLDALQGGGGTMMIEGIKASLGGQSDNGRMRVVAFLTDGYIGNEREIFAAVRERIGQARLFSFGIGSSVNRYLLEGLAEEGRGEAAFRSPLEDAGAMVARFVNRISSPVLTDVRLSFEGLEVFDIEPMPIPDLFAGQPLVISGRYHRAHSGLVLVEGRLAGRPVTYRHVVHLPERDEEHEALGRLWARARIHRLERELHGGPQESVVERIVSLALRHRLMTRYTSLVAVDSEISNHDGSSTSVEVPVELPQDVPLSAIGNQQTIAGLSRKAPRGYLSAPSRTEELTVTGGAFDASREPRDKKVRNETRPDSEAAVAFDSITLVQAGGARIVVEADGEVWRIAGPRRSLVRTLDGAALESLARLLASTHPQRWAAAPREAERLELRTAHGSYSVAISGASGELAALVGELRRLGQGALRARRLHRGQELLGAIGADAEDGAVHQVQLEGVPPRDREVPAAFDGAHAEHAAALHFHGGRRGDVRQGQALGVREHSKPHPHRLLVHPHRQGVEHREREEQHESRHDSHGMTAAAGGDRSDPERGRHEDDQRDDADLRVSVRQRDGVHAGTSGVSA